MDPRFAASAICRFRDLPLPRFAASAICRFRDLPHPRSGRRLARNAGAGWYAGRCARHDTRQRTARARYGLLAGVCPASGALRASGGFWRVPGGVWRVTPARAGTPVGARATIRASGPARARCGLLVGVCPASDADRASGGFWRVPGGVWRVTPARAGTPVGARATIRASGPARARCGLLAGVCPASDAVRASGGFWRVLGGLARYGRDRSGSGARTPDVSPYP